MIPRCLLLPLVGLVLLGLVACETTKPRGEVTMVVNHVVVCWLKNPRDTFARDKLVAGADRLKAIPGVVNVSAGYSLPSDGTGVDSSFDVAIVMTFASEEALRAYNQHPMHKQAVADILMPLTRRVIIYDARVMDPNPALLNQSPAGPVMPARGEQTP